MRNIPKDFRGKTGVVTQVAWVNSQPRITIELDDSHQRLVLTSGVCLGFVAEKEALEKLVGRTF